MSFHFPRIVLAFVLAMTALVHAQDDSVPPSPGDAPQKACPAPPATTDQWKQSEEKLAAQTQEEVAKIAKTIDQDPRAKTAAAGILQPIYAVAETLAFPAFHWLAFALMYAGVVSYMLQLVLGKLDVLSRMGFSLKEIISDAVSLAISVFGLVLTTQAAAENSTFTQSPAAVISATVVGVVAGVILYSWGQAQELEAVAGRSRPAPTVKK